MINAMLKDGLGVININGTLSELISDLTIMVKHIYDDMAKEDKTRAELFKKGVKDVVSNVAFMPEDDSIAFIKSVIDKKKKEKKEEKKEEAEENLDEMFDELKDSFEEFMKALKGV